MKLKSTIILLIILILYNIQLYADNPNNKKKQFENYFLSGKQLLDKGEYKKAIEMFDKAINLQTSNSEIYFRRGNAYSFLNEPQKRSLIIQKHWN